MDFHFTVYKGNETIDLTLDTDVTMRDIYKELMKRNDFQNIYLRIKKRGDKFQYDLNYIPSAEETHMIIIRLDEELCMYMEDVEVIENNNFDEGEITELNWVLNLKKMMILSLKGFDLETHFTREIKLLPLKYSRFLTYVYRYDYKCGMIEKYNFAILDGLMTVLIQRDCPTSGTRKEIFFKIKATTWYW